MTEPTATTLLRARNLHVAFGTGEKQVLAVKGVNFHISKGETVALVGESGSGKTVSALSILRLLSYPPASHPKGEIFFDGVDLLSAPEATLRNVRTFRPVFLARSPKAKPCAAKTWKTLLVLCALGISVTG